MSWFGALAAFLAVGLGAGVGRASSPARSSMMPALMDVLGFAVFTPHPIAVDPIGRIDAPRGGLA